LGFGETAPWFTAKSCANDAYAFSSVGGRHVLLAFFGTLSHGAAAQAHDLVRQRRGVFDDDRACFFGVSVDPADQSVRGVKQSLPGLRYFWDFDFAVSRLYQAAPSQTTYLPCWVALDQQLRVIAKGPIETIGAGIDLIEQATAGAVSDVPAPVLVLPRVFEPEFCRELIALYQNGKAADSGFMRERDGKTVYMTDHDFKRRTDVTISSAAVRKRIQGMIFHRLNPQVERSFNFKPTRMERYIVARYDASTGGFFRPHRDNTTAGTAHRRFAVTINLNAEDYEGGDLRFPEFGPRTYRAPTGGAVVFSCGLLHEATPMLRGERYAFLPFLYDEAAAKVREQNNAYLGDGVEPYKPDGAR
jgi:predicted 2-oxoglutarate/Fe(II)-dependent dioxygenase YbiX/peroxiredoxin